MNHEAHRLCLACGSEAVEDGVWVCGDCGAEHEVQEIAEGTPSVLEVISDEDSRAILRSLNDGTTPREVSEDCDIPLSTVYRKLGSLKETSLVTASPRVDTEKTGGHAETFRTNFENVTVELSDGGDAILVHVSRDDGERDG